MHGKRPEREVEMKRRRFPHQKKRPSSVADEVSVRARANTNPILGCDGITESRENPVSPTIMAIILTWPTFPPAYRFPMKMELHISLSSPRSFRVTGGISRRGETDVRRCARSDVFVATDTCERPPRGPRCKYTAVVIITGFSGPSWS